MFNDTLKSINIQRSLIVVCYTENATLIDICLSKLGYKIVSYADNSPKKQGKTVKHKKILSIEDAVNLYKNAQFLVAEERHYEVLKKQISNLGVCDDDIINIDLYSILELKHAFPDKWFCEDDCYIYHNPQKKGTWFYINRFINWLRCKKYELRFKDTHIAKKTYYSSMCAIFKNEAPYLAEWIEFYRNIGLDHLYLYNNESTDNYFEKIQPYIESGFVTLTEWPYAQGQLSAYKDCIDRNRDEVNWIGFIDLDEFVTPLLYDSINEFLSEFEGYGSILIPQIVYGSAGIESRDIRESVLKTFKYSWQKHSDVGKCFFNTEYEIDEKRSPIFHHYIWCKQGKIKYPTVNVFKQVCFFDYARYKKKAFPIELRHYAIKSREEYRRKIRKTDVFFEKNSHTDNAFFFHDIRSTKKNNEIYGN